jgi:hypothetical protein
VPYLGSPYFSGYANDNRSADTSAVVSAKCRYRNSRVKGFPALLPRARARGSLLVIEEQPQVSRKRALKRTTRNHKRRGGRTRVQQSTSNLSSSWRVKQRKQHVVTPVGIF